MTASRRTVQEIVAQLCLILGIILHAAVVSADPTPSPHLTIKRAVGPIALDGDLSDAGWQEIEPINTWFETNPGESFTTTHSLPIRASSAFARSIVASEVW